MCASSGWVYGCCMYDSSVQCMCIHINCVYTHTEYTHTHNWCVYSVCVIWMHVSFVSVHILHACVSVCVCPLGWCIFCVCIICICVYSVYLPYVCLCHLYLCNFCIFASFVSVHIPCGFFVIYNCVISVFAQWLHVSIFYGMHCSRVGRSLGRQELGKQTLLYYEQLESSWNPRDIGCEPMLS